MDLGVGQSATAPTFLESIWTRPGSTTNPRNCTLDEWNSHFSGLTYKWLSRRRLSTCLTCCVFLKGARKDEDVIQVNEHEDVKHIPKHIVYERLEHSQGIGQAEGHHQVLVVTSRHVESGLPLVTVSDPQKMVCVPHVKFSEDNCVLEQLKCCGHKG